MVLVTEEDDTADTADEESNLDGTNNNADLGDHPGGSPPDEPSNFAAVLEMHRESHQDETALQPGHLDMLMRLVQEGWDVNDRPGKPPPLFTAIVYNNIEAIKYLLDNGANQEFNFKSMEDEEAFLREFIVGKDPFDPEMYYPIWKGAYTQYIKSGCKMTAIHAGAIFANLSTIKFLLDLGPHIELDGGPFSPLHLAVRSGRLEMVKYLVDRCVIVNPNCGDGILTPLHIAVMYDDIDLVQFLVMRLKAKTEVTCTFKQSTPLHLATFACQVDIIKFLIRHGANLTAFTDHGETPLHLAALESLDAVRCLVQNGAPILTTNMDLETALHMAVVRRTRPSKNESLDIVKYLVQQGAKVNARNSRGFTPLMIETSTTPINVEILEYLVRVGAGVNHVSTRTGDTAVHFSAEVGDVSAIEFLVEAGANLNLPNNDGECPSHIAANGGHIECLKSLLQNGADIHALDNFSRTPLDHAIMGLHVDVIEYLLEMGAELNCLDTEPKRRPPLFRAIEANSLTLVKLLVQKGASLEAANEYWKGPTPLHFVVISYSKIQNFDMLRYFVEDAKVPVDTLATGYVGTVLHVACADDKADLKVVEYLLAAGANVNSLAGVAGGEVTPLYRAVANGNVSIMKCLVEHGADVNAGGESTSMPLYLAVIYRDLEAVKYLIENGASLTRKSGDEDKGYTVNTLLRESLDSKDVTSSPLLLVIYLIETHGADPEYRDKLGYNLVALAAQESHWDVVEYLVSDMSQLCLHEAAGTGNLEAVKEIIDMANVPIDSRQYIDTTPLQLAARGGHVEVVKYLLERGADASATNFHASVLHFTVNQEGDAHIECLKLVLEALKIKFRGKQSIAFREHINTGDRDGDTPVTWSIASDSLEQTAILLEHGADPLVKNKEGETGFDWARKSETKASELLKILGAEY